MLCRQHSIDPTPEQIRAVPSRSLKWHRWPTALPRAANDNRHPSLSAAIKAGWLAVNALAGVGLIAIALME
ncbi:hypothetical protein OPKNFCMD_3973 [Methylobacterium crusticola]|uniref:Uncharacterized protein n=1 Tax=Methylobacterium crusticola TaxID=1697972 RepID=A0ABQ4R1Q6_9HYPH|nr:hypothetical protein [Methylobacterium crusticola]GJD51221.1 hypothetical protein OPKNFCMD_3973 [Methylobacterium crusticola]